MKVINTIIIVLLFIVSLNAQDYFQQKVDYSIDVSLNTDNDILSGEEVVHYKNNSSNSLKFVYFHLWANAYKSKKSAYNKQALRDNDHRFERANKDEMGGYKSIRFSIGKVEIIPEYLNDEVVKIVLPEVLNPRNSIDIKIEFELDIPYKFSRMGQRDGAFFMAQWYPKPAVYDNEGWHTMQYLSNGEFYSEFGDFDVTITLPNDFVVAATGELQSKLEKEFLLQKIEETKRKIEGKTIESTKHSNDVKIVKYKVENVHDFAWFASRKFNVMKDEVKLNSGKTVDTWAFFFDKDIDLWKDATKYIGRAVKFYSDKVGEYPYSHATAVRGFMSGGMEYPMITEIGRMDDGEELDDVIAHEVGHNWFYGILGFNERDHAWLDEGINSYYEKKYMKAFYDNPTNSEFMLKGTNLNFDLITYLLIAKNNKVPCDTKAEDFSDEIQYYFASYLKPPMIYSVLENSLGTEQYDIAMKKFFEEWKFKHPSPEDFKTSLTNSTNKNLDWLFEDLIKSTKKIDYRISRQRNRDNMVVVNQKSDISAPFCIIEFMGDDTLSSKWYDGVDEKLEVEISDKADRVVLVNGLDANLRNNTVWLSSSILKKIPQPKFAFGFQDLEKPTIYYLPIIGYNYYDKLMLGFNFRNHTIFESDFNYSLSPMFGFGSKDIVGMGHIDYLKSTGNDTKLEIGVDLRRFNYNYSKDYKYYDRYHKFAPYMKLSIEKKTISHEIEFRLTNIYQYAGHGDNLENLIWHREKHNYMVNSITYTFKKKFDKDIKKVVLNIDQGKGVLRPTLVYKQTYEYDSGRFFYFRGFAGKIFADGNNQKFNYYLDGVGKTGFYNYQHDYKHDKYLIGRNENDNLWGNQIFEKDANIHTIATHIISSNWMISGNLAADIPIPKVPIAIYFDYVFYDYFGRTAKDYTLGIDVRLMKNIISIYFPLWNSQGIKSNINFKDEKYKQKIMFTLNLHKLKPYKLLQKIG